MSLQGLERLSQQVEACSLSLAYLWISSLQLRIPINIVTWESPLLAVSYAHPRPSSQSA